MSDIRKNVHRLPGDVHVNQALTNVSILYMQNVNHFIADKVFPIVSVAKQSDIIWAYNRGDWTRRNVRKRAPGTEAKIAGFGTLKEHYFAEERSLGHDIYDQTRANADSVFNLDRDATNWLTQQMLIEKELDFVENYLVAGKWGTDLTGQASAPGAGQFLQWDNAASTPIEDVRAAKRAVLELTGFEPNKFVLGKKVYDDLVDHPDIVDRVKYGQTPNGAALVNMQALAALFEVDEILVSKAIVNDAKEGAEDDTRFIASNNALLVYTPATPSTFTPAAGYTFSWNGAFGASPSGFRVRKFRMEKIKSDRIEIEAYYDQKLLGADLGVMFVDAVAADA